MTTVTTTQSRHVATVYPRFRFWGRVAIIGPSQKWEVSPLMRWKAAKNLYEVLNRTQLEQVTCTTQS